MSGSPSPPLPEFLFGILETVPFLGQWGYVVSLVMTYPSESVPGGPGGEVSIPVSPRSPRPKIGPVNRPPVSMDLMGTVSIRTCHLVVGKGVSQHVDVGYHPLWTDPPPCLICQTPVESPVSRVSVRPLRSLGSGGVTDET